MALCTVDGGLLEVNDALASLLGREGAELRGRSLLDFTLPAAVPAAQEVCERLGDSRTLSRHESVLVRVDGTEILVLVTASWVDEELSGGAHLVMHIEDITERKTYESELVHQALHDQLTGLASRGLFMQRLSQVAAAGRRGQELSVLYLDLDHFKQVNDLRGHAAGDGVLVAFAARLRDNVRPADTVARLGGDEFAVLCESGGAANARRIAERLVRATREVFALPVGDLWLSVSAGVIVSDRTPASAETMLAAADAAMYRAKAAGRDRYVIDSAWMLNSRRFTASPAAADSG